MDHSHLDALESRLVRERTRLAQAKNAAEVEFRTVQVAACEREIANEREFLGLGAETAITEDELFAELEGCF